MGLSNGRTRLVFQSYFPKCEERRTRQEMIGFHNRPPAVLHENVNRDRITQHRNQRITQPFICREAAHLWSLQPDKLLVTIVSPKH